jgi:hypothetical protein
VGRRLSKAAQRAALWPPFFDGRVRMQVVMAVSTWGPMRFMEISALTGESANANPKWNNAAKYLERLGVLVRHHNNPRHVVVGLDRRHPAFKEIQRFGKALYPLYIAPDAPWTPEKRKNPLPVPGTKHDPADLDLHVLGRSARTRMLHLIAETSSSPGYVLVQSLGLSHGSYASLGNWERHGVVLRRYERRHTNVSVKRFAVHLDRSWPAHRALWTLLKKLNSWMPDYGDAAEAYRSERDAGRHTNRWKIQQTRRRKRQRLVDAGPR